MIKKRKISQILSSVFSVVLMVGLVSCGGDSKESDNPVPVDTATAVKLSSVSANQTMIDTAAQMTVMNFFTYSAANRPSDPPDPPEIPSKSKSISKSKSSKVAEGCGDTWFGPDAAGWYSRSCQWGYGDSELTEYIRAIPASELLEGEVSGREYKAHFYMGDASGNSSFDIKAKTILNDNGLLSGRYDFSSSSFGTVIDSVGAAFVYNNFDPKTGAGHFEWWWGGDINSFIPYDLYLTIDAIDKGNNTLSVKVTWDEFTSWEYECPYYTMPGIQDFVLFP